MFSHSLFFDRTMFAARAARFGRAYRVVACDHRGQGTSTRSTGVDMDTPAEDLAALVEALDLGRHTSSATPCWRRIRGP